MTENNPLKKISLLNPIHLLAVGFGSGLIHPAPGTWGSLAGTILGVILLSLLGVKIFLIFTSLCFLLGCYLCQKTTADMGVHDHGSIVWDEFVGVFYCISGDTVIILAMDFGCFCVISLFRYFKTVPNSLF